MKIKRYTAPDMRRAMRQVRDKQGPDAVILSSRRIDDGVEVIAAIDYDAGLLNTAPGQLEDAAEPAATHEEAAAPEITTIGRAAQVWAQESSIQGMQQEVASLRKLLESQLASLAWNDTARRHPIRAAVIRELASLGLSRQLAGSIAAEVAETNIETATGSALQLLKQRIPLLDREIFDPPGAVALVGPTGVGKTTTIAKLAARFALKHGANALALLTTDGFRIGAQEQLMTFGRILGVPVQHVRNSAELATALNVLSDKKLILIDSAGMSQRDQRINQEFSALRETGSKLRILLTLSSNAQAAVIEETTRAFRHLAPVACILTKVDETGSLGGAITSLIRHQLPLAYVTDGQRVPEDLHWAGSKRFSLIERALELRNAESLQDRHEVLVHA